MPQEFERPATDETIDKVVAALTANNIEAVVLASSEGVACASAESNPDQVAAPPWGRSLQVI